MDNMSYKNTHMVGIALLKEGVTFIFERRTYHSILGMGGERKGVWGGRRRLSKTAVVGWWWLGIGLGITAKDN